MQQVVDVARSTHWARLKINEFWGPWVKFPGATYEQTERVAMKMTADLIGWWNIKAEYQISSTVPMEE